MSQSIEMKLLLQVLEEVRELREEQRLRMEPRALPTLLPLSDAATEMGVSPRTLRRMVRNGQVLPVRIKDALKIPASEIRRLATAVATPFPSAHSPGSGKALPKKTPLSKGYSPEMERRKLAELRKKRRR